MKSKSILQAILLSVFVLLVCSLRAKDNKSYFTIKN
jgi:hypothetical protein